MATFLGTLQVQGELIVPAKQAGFAVIPEGASDITVLFGSGFIGTPIVTASPDVPVLYAVWKTTQTGFTIRLAGPTAEKITFAWHALSTGEVHAAPTVEQVVQSGAIIFPIDTKNIPVSSNKMWNACIRSITLLDESGQPYSCSRYHNDNTWTHPDLNIEFLWNDSVTPALLELPEGYGPAVTETAESVEYALQPMGGIAPGVEDMSSSSASSSLSEDSEETEESEETDDTEESSSSSSDSSVSSESSSELSSSSESSTPVTVGEIPVQLWSDGASSSSSEDVVVPEVIEIPFND
jgi:hypothetical protein